MIRQAKRIVPWLRWWGPALALVLSCCTVPDLPKPDDNVFPATYKEDVVFYMPTHLQDATNIRGAFISEPVLMPVGSTQRWTSCVRFNPRMAGRRYSGSEDRLAIFYGGQLTQFIAATPAQCANAAYKPFPELEKICRAERCD